MKLIGLTGGIGSGKSTVAKIFRCLQVPVIEADAVGRMMLAENEKVKLLVKKAFGEQVYTDGFPNRKLIASIVFSDDEALKTLNGIIHPAVNEYTIKWMQSWQGKAPYVVKEAAILFESGSADACDEVIAVAAPEAIRLKRTCLRDGVTKEEVLNRMNKQWSEQDRIKHANHIIINDGSTPLIPQVICLHQAFKA